MPATTPPYASISEVLRELDRVIAHCLAKHSRLGYFAVLYRNVTARVQQNLTSGRFQDPARLERLDIFFAHRYLEAFDQYSRGETPTRSWAVAFEAARHWPPIILQHLVLGINAHVNLDLAIAAAQTAPGEELPLLKHDFDAINQLLIEMIVEVQSRIDRVSPWFRLLNRVSGTTDEDVGALGLQVSRRRAWQVAQQLAFDDPAQLEQDIAIHDKRVGVLARGVYAPILSLRGTHMLIRLRESNDVPFVMQTLSI
jgi:hypothetical protein